MIEVDFDWDKLFASSSFSEIRRLSPELSDRRLPSSFSPDRSLFYISSLDDYCSTADADALKARLKELGERFHSLSVTEYRRKYLTHSDFEQVCLLLYGLGEDDCNYGLPDEVLEETSNAPK